MNDSQDSDSESVTVGTIDVMTACSHTAIPAVRVSEFLSPLTSGTVLTRFVEMETTTEHTKCTHFVASYEVSYFE